MYLSTIPIGSVAYASVGTNTTDINGQWWVTDIFVPYNIVATKLGFLQGGTATTDNTMLAIWDGSGRLIGNSATAGVLLSGANTFQEQALLTATQLYGPQYYFVGVQGNGTAAGAIQTIPTATFLGIRTNVVAGTFGTTINLVPPTAFTAGQGPVIYIVPR